MGFENGFELETKKTSEDVRKEDHPKVLPKSSTVNA